MEIHTLPVNQESSLNILLFEGLLRPSFISQRQTDGPPKTWDTSDISGNVFAHPQASSSAPYPQGLNSTWKKTIEEPIHMSTAEKSGRPERDQDLRCQSGPSAKDSVIFSGGVYSKNYAADQQRLQISDLHFDKFPTPATFACWKIRFKTEVCTCSQFPTEAMQWIKEVEVDSVDELRSSSSTRGISMPNFEVLDARIASALNKIIHNSHFKRKISLEEQKAQKEDRFFGGRQIAYFIYEQFRVTGTHEVSSKIYEIRILAPEVENLRRTPWSRIREQNSVYKEFFEIVGNGKPTGNVWKETIAVSATISISVEKLHHQNRLRILPCSRVSENHRGPEVPEVKVPVVERLDGLARITLEELAITHSVKDGILQNACSTRPRVVAVLGRSAHSHIVRLTHSPTKWSKSNNDKSAVAILKKEKWQERESDSDACHDRTGKPVRKSDKKLGQNSSRRQFSDARQLGCVFQDMTPPKSILRKGTDMPKPIQRVKFTKAIARHTKIRDQNPSLGYIYLSR